MIDLVQGYELGHWRGVLKTNMVIVQISLSRRLKRPEMPALDTAVQRYVAFTGLPYRPLAELAVSQERSE